MKRRSVTLCLIILRHMFLWPAILANKAAEAPPLRYTAYTAPYMHNGALFELREVVEFYNDGGGTNEFAANKTKLLKPLNRTEEEIVDLAEFLVSLSRPEIKMKTPKLPPYAPLPTN